MCLLPKAVNSVSPDAECVGDGGAVYNTLTAVAAQEESLAQEICNQTKAERQLRAITSRQHARNYINLKIRQRAFVMLFIETFRKVLATLKEGIHQELESRDIQI